MKLHVLLLAAPALLLLSGCPKPDTRPVAGGPGGSASTPTPTAPSSTKCLAADTVASNCRRVSGVMTCRLSVSPTSTVPVVLPYRLKVGQHGPNREALLIWELIGDEIEFTDRHGPMLNGRPLRDDSRFKDGWPSNDPNGATKDDPGRYYRVIFKNEAGTPTAGLEYVITFRNAPIAGQTAAPKEHGCDPLIVNQSG